MFQMKHLQLLLFFLVIKSSQNRRLWEKPVTEISWNLTQQDEPIDSPCCPEKLQISDLKGTLYQNTLSKLENITELRLIRNQITKIEPGALCSSKNLKILELDFSGNKNAVNLTKDDFKNCNLTELFLKFNSKNLCQIENNILEDLTNLNVFGIDGLRIQHLSKRFLTFPKSLTALELSDLHIEKIDNNVFDDLTDLERLEIVHNPELTNIPHGLFKKSSKLEILILKDNHLSSLSWNEFEGLSGLKKLDLFDNLIQTCDVEKVAKNIPNIEEFILEFNNISCKNLEKIREELTSKLNRSVEVPALACL